MLVWSVHWHNRNVKFPYYYCITTGFSCYCTIICCMYSGAAMLDAYLQFLYPLLDRSFYHYVMPFFISYCGLCLEVWYKYCYPSFFFLFLLPFSWLIFFHLFTFSLYLSLYLRWASCRQHIDVSSFLIYSLCLLIRLLGPFTFKVLIRIYLLPFCSLFLLVFLVLPCSFLCLLHSVLDELMSCWSNVSFSFYFFVYF